MEHQKITIKQWAEDDRPREKLMLKGKTSLSDAELLAILIGSGHREESAVELCKRILAMYNNNLSVLAKQSISKLTAFKGIGEAKAIAIIAALEIGQRRRLSERIEEPIITTSSDVFELISPIIGDLEHEEFWVLYLNNSNKVKYKAPLSKGGITGTVVDIRLLFQTALEQKAVGIILTHNHPSGKVKPSDADIQITKKIKEAGRIMDIQLLDHLIITEYSYYSFADESIL
ncbi:DNA repair protein RadC [Myroides odoratimimus]|uniref:RadC family protein n=1 Tax=Myroides odoratimimus TaxID=76832 RepID=UPI00024604D7|nr:DNA repair protein RadC [Myroides odoratimimus]EHO05719.1 DNA repair protein RadC [Myroides odoratimimus CCUG 12901]MCO7723011.1 DNA repair protein RadC [Myroides odoratimimus]MCS7472894.1 DNA repair protein RadC [Myroides odoratimimus]MDM1038924.1 DNA repair protein RadC [Myroides odoratimimus]MDM1053111.1 DNA repair protein RadC [Myroides odoratimimus]